MNIPPTTRRQLFAHCALAMALAMAVSVYLSWPALVRADRFHDNWRQAPQWLSPDKQHFQDDDLLLAYSQFNTSPFGNLLYKTLARTGHDLVWGKVMTVVVFTLGALTCFLAAHAMCGLPAGWVSVVLFLFLPSMHEHFVGGFMSAFSWPLLALAVLLIYRQRWWWSIPLVAFSAFTYPMVGLHIGAMYFLDTIFHDVINWRLNDKRVWRTKILPLTLAAASLLAVLGSKYFAEHDFGELVTRADMQDRIEFTNKGRYKILPTTALWKRFERQWENPFHFPMFVVAVLFLGRGAFRLPRGLYVLLFASILMYYLADYFVMQLYLPSRYIRRSLPLFACLVGAVWWARIYFDALRSTTADRPPRSRARRLLPLAVMTVVLTGLGVREFGDDLDPGDDTHVYNRHGIYQAIREQPGRPMIAAWPRLASELPIMTGRTVLISKEMAHPWWTDYWQEISERTQEYWRAYYTLDPAELKRIIDKYDIDYWVIEPRYYRREYVNRRKIHYQPLDSWLKRLPRPRGALLSRVPADLRLYEDEDHYLVASADILRWLETR